MLYWINRHIIGTHWQFRSVIGALLTVQELGVFIVHSNDNADLANTLKWLYERDRSVEYTPKPRKVGVLMTDEEKLLCALPGIGPVRATSLLAEFGTVARVLAAISQNENIRRVLGLSDNEVLKITEVKK